VFVTPFGNPVTGLSIPRIETITVLPENGYRTVAK